MAKYRAVCSAQVWFPFFEFEVREGEDPYDVMHEVYENNHGNIKWCDFDRNDIESQLIPDDGWEPELIEE